jgi:hypothetical protein
MRRVTAASAAKNGPAFQDRLVGPTDAGDLDHMVQNREPDKAVLFRPLRLRLHRLECLGRIGSIGRRRVANAELHGYWLLYCLD